MRFCIPQKSLFTVSFCFCISPVTGKDHVFFWLKLRLASPQTSFGARLSRIQRTSAGRLNQGEQISGQYFQESLRRQEIIGFLSSRTVLNLDKWQIKTVTRIIYNQYLLYSIKAKQRTSYTVSFSIIHGFANEQREKGDRIERTCSVQSFFCFLLPHFFDTFVNFENSVISEPEKM